jgi:prolyl-tRNA editing enzyme YbaK/EbsC (Cys-tRNA(Pro) deacylase)
VAWLVLHEPLNAAQLSGGLLVLAGVVLAETARTAGPDGGTSQRARQDWGMTSDQAPLHPSAQAVQDALDAAGTRDAAGRPCAVRVLDQAVHTAAAAAAALGIQVGQIANSLIFDADGEPLLVLMSGAHRVDTAKAAEAMGARKVHRASAEFVREHTGQVIGGVSPLGHPKPVRTLIDPTLAEYDEIWAAGGIPQAVFPVTYAELVRVTGGTPAAVA